MATKPKNSVTFFTTEAIAPYRKHEVFTVDAKTAERLRKSDAVMERLEEYSAKKHSKYVNGSAEAVTGADLASDMVGGIENDEIVTHKGEVKDAAAQRAKTGDTAELDEDTRVRQNLRDLEEDEAESEDTNSDDTK